MLRSRKVEAIKVHHLVSSRYEVMGTNFFSASELSVDFSEGAELGVLNRRRGPTRLPVHLSSPVFGDRGPRTPHRLPRLAFPLRAHVEQIHEKVIGERLLDAW